MRKLALGKSQVESSARSVPKRIVPPLMIPKHSFHVPGRRSPLLSARDRHSAMESLEHAEEKQSATESAWTAEERDRVETHFVVHGRDFKHIAALMGTKTPAQVKGYWKMIQERNSIRGENGKSTKQEKKKSRRHSSGDKLSPLQARLSSCRRQGTLDSTRKDLDRENRKRDADEADL
eukprot:IDg8374t1